MRNDFPGGDGLKKRNIDSSMFRACRLVLVLAGIVGVRYAHPAALMPSVARDMQKPSVEEDITFYGPCWADSSGKDGKGGVSILCRDDEHKFLLRPDPCRERMESAIGGGKAEWILFDSEANDDHCLSFEFTWVTHGDNKHWDKKWLGGGVAFNDSWAGRDLSEAKNLVLYARTDTPGVDFETALTGDVDSGSVKLAGFAEGKRIGTHWTRIVIPFASFPNHSKMSSNNMKTLNFNLAGDYPENKRVYVHFDKIHVTDIAILTPVENLGWFRVPDGVRVMWDKTNDEGIQGYQVTLNGKTIDHVEGAAQRQVKLSSAVLPVSGAYVVGVAAQSGKQTSSYESVTVTGAPATAKPASVTLAAELGRPISPYLWGYNYMDAENLKKLGATVNRWGGNATTNYNWKDDSDNRGGDWYFLNTGAPPKSGREEDKGYAKFITQAFSAGCQAIITIPTIGWVAKPVPEGGPRLCSFPTSKFPGQTADDGQGAGNGRLPGDKYVRGNDPNSNYVQVDPGFQKEWVQTIVKLFKPAAQGGVKFYQMDNEPGCWIANHRDVWPQGVGYDQLVDLNARYARVVKEADPGAQVIGWSGWGIMELAGSNWDYMPGGVAEFDVEEGRRKSSESWTDRKAHGDLPQVVYFLREMKKRSDEAGVRLIDYLDNHGCPDVWDTDSQGKTISMSGDYPYDPVVTPKQFEALRVWWDPTFEDPHSWCANEANKPYLWDPFVGMIPKMKKIIAENYPGTKYSITEYYAASPSHYHGGLLEAVKQGIFMREGVDMACDWGGAKPDNFLFLAHRLYSNYDGTGSKVNGNTVNTLSSSPDLDAFGAKDAARTFVVLVNKNHDAAFETTITLPVSVTSYQTYSFTEHSGKRIVDSGPQNVSSPGLKILVPAFSAMLVVAR